MQAIYPLIRNIACIFFEIVPEKIIIRRKELQFSKNIVLKELQFFTYMELILKAKNIYVEYTGREILSIDDLEIHACDRIGLIGGNGSGKTTLLHILSGKYTPPGCRIHRFGSTSLIPQAEGVRTEESYDPSLLSRLGVSGLQYDTMSGGEITRMKIALALSQPLHALLADEPTCHLDREGIDLLINQLDSFNSAILIVSHDRYFLDKTVNKIWELKDAKITEYWGGYSEYLHQKQEEREYLAAEYVKYSEEKNRLKRAVSEKRSHAEKIDKKQIGVERKNANELNASRGNQKPVGSKQQKLYSAAQNMEKRIEALGEVKPPEHIRSIRFRKNPALELHNKFPIIGENLHLRFGKHQIFENTGFIIPLGSKVALTGNNGSGKTSLMKMILEHSAGLTISPKVVMGYLSQLGYQVPPDRQVLSFMQENCDYQEYEIRSVLVSMGFKANDIHKNLRVLSGGEINKLLLSKMLLGRYNILLMDEPSNYLDIFSIEALEKMMKDYTGTILFITHDQRLIDNAADIVFEIKDCKIHTKRER